MEQMDTFDEIVEAFLDDFSIQYEDLILKTSKKKAYEQAFNFALKRLPRKLLQEETDYILKNLEDIRNTVYGQDY